MGHFSVLITGASGTGKELVARAVGLSRYIPFDISSERFAFEPDSQFLPLNVSALSRSLLESELFGHCKGAFTGAMADHAGYLESCTRNGTVFLDEIGEIEPEVQVKLLRVIETGEFHRLGETEVRRFEGKLIAATNRDLAAEMAEGRFRSDFFYRLCSDIVRTPSLGEQVHGAVDELRGLVTYLALRIVGDGDADEVTDDVMEWIETELGLDYAWPGNVRELDQCVRNVVVRKRYVPPETGRTDVQAAVQQILAGSLTADELMSWYCTRVYAATGSYQETGRRLELDHRTVKSKIDADLLERLTGGSWHRESTRE
jgi:transcriptional regulator with GAF, ATPase, and Fis domain